ncbi:hypothetical protein [Micromonospora sp. NPDC048063]|uniref:hypothetical protein n=1 Tax=Micromonospora sp. NPDC048063 TaxID=3364256 RepID=UPI003718907A
MTSVPRPGRRRAARWAIGAVTGTVLLPVLAGCAAPGTGPGTGPASSNSAASALPATSAAITEARCVRAATPVARPGEVARPGTATATPSRPGSGQPLTDEQRREEFRRQQAANDAFRQRGTLDAKAASGARACAAEVLRRLNLLTVGGRDDPGEESVRRAVAATGLAGVTVRPPGRLDLGPGDGLLFAGWTGRACVFGSVRAGDVAVEIGTRIADGGCLPAPG